MNTDKELMQQALEALVWECGSEPSLYAPKTAATITALRERLAQPEMQPCAGRNCGSTNPNLHSAECFEDYEKATGIDAQHPGIEELEHENRLMRARNERLQAEVDRLEQEQTAAWTPVSEAMPKPMVRVLIYYKTSAGFGRRIRGEWIPAKTEEATAENENGEYDEEADTYWIPEGWYECIDNWDEYSSVKVCEGEVTHWMPLPPAPIVEGKPDAA